MAEGISAPQMVQDPQMKDTLQILRDGVMQNSAPSKLPLIAKMSLWLRIKEQERAGWYTGECGEIPLVTEGELGGKVAYFCDPVTAFTLHLEQITTSLQVKKSCNRPFCTKMYLQTKLHKTLQGWCDLLNIWSWLASLMAWSGLTPHQVWSQRAHSEISALVV